ncbi:MAG TPA: SDR family NAD(P)-dependent oxidoreductase [bacterium]
MIETPLATAAIPQRQWFISDASTHFGSVLAQAVLDQGDRVIGAVRTLEQSDAFDRLAPGRSIGRVVNFQDPEAIRLIVIAVEQSLGPIDVMVNLSCCRHEGTIEESGLEDLRHQFERNVFTTVSAIRAVLPFMRARRRGHIVNLTSVGGLVTLPGRAFYHGSKFALEGITEALGKEVRPLGIYVTAVEPGAFPLGSPPQATQAKRHIGDYEPVLAGRAMDALPSDPEKVAQAVVAAVNSPEPPAHLVLGSDALAQVRGKLYDLALELQTWEATSLSTSAA